MGGKHNLANRTKNNARPSSSGRSAAMLNSSLPQFGGFSGLKESSGLTSFTFGPIEDFDSSVEESFQLVIKKISKKDSTTKLKGLQEFAELVQNAEPEVVKAILPIWPRFYSVLATDPDNRVREATHNVHHKIVIKVKRNIAPYLKQLMAPWFTSQYDNYPPAATAAFQAFKDTFSESKFQEAIIFCQDEILYYIYETLSDQIIHNITGKTVATKDAEDGAKYERTLVSCLQGYSLYLQKVPEEKIRESAEINSKIVLDKRFWKLATSNISLVRSAWFQVLSVILQKALFLLKDKESQVLNTTLSNLEDDDPIVVPHVWDCLLLATSVIQNWSNYVKIENILIPKLIKVLQRGGQGNATIIYPNLLPLLSNLPTMDKEKATQFYNSFFDAIRFGLKLKSEISSKSELTAIAVAFIECIQFLIIKKPSDIDLCKSLIKDQLVSTIEWCITDDNPYYKTIFSQISAFIQYLSRINNSDIIQPLVEFCVDNIQHMFSVLLQPNSTNIYNVSLISERQIELVRSLKHSSRPKKDSHVKFIFENNEKIHSSKKCPESMIQNESYLKLIDQLAVKIFKDYANYITVNSSKDLVDKLCSLVLDFDKNIFFESFLNEMRIMNDNTKFIDIYEHLFKKWLTSDDIYCKSIIDLIFLLMNYLEDPEKEAVLDDLTRVNQPDCLMWSVSTALSFPHVENAVIQKWLKEEEVGLFFISIAEKQISNECSPELGVILKLALTENRNGDLYVTKNVLSQIIEKISSTLLDDKNEVLTLDPCSSLASHLCSIIYTETLYLIYGDKLLLTLIQLTCKYETENDYLSQETIWEIKSAWQDALVVLLSNLNETENKNLVEKIAVTIENQFFLASDTSKEHMEHLAIVIFLSIKSFYKSTSPVMSFLVEIIFKRPWIIEKNIVVEVCKVAEYVKGNLGSPYGALMLDHPLKEKEIFQYFTWWFVKLYALCLKLNMSEQIDYGEQCQNDDCEDLTELRLLDVVNNPEDHLLEALYFYTIGDSFLLHFNNVKYYKEILYYNSWLEKKLQECFSYLDENTLANVKIKLKNNCLSCGWFWCKSAYTFYVKLLGISDYSTVYTELTESVLENNFGIMHINQIFKNDTAEAIAKMPSEIIENTVSKVMDQMEKLRKENISEFLYDDSDKISCEKAEEVIQVVRLNSNLIKYCPLTQTYWDFVVISLASWVSNCLKARELVHTFQYQSMLISVSELYVNICVRVAKLKEENVNTNFVNEWEDVLQEGIQTDFAQIWLFLAEHLSTESGNTICNLPLMQYFGPVTEHLKYELIFKSSDKIPKWTKFLKICCSLLTNSQAAFQLWGYRMLTILLPGLVQIDTEAVNTRTPHKKGLIFEQFKEKLTEVQNVVNSILMDFRLGENTCRIEPSYDSFTYTFAYLLLWDAMLCLCETASAELRYQYADWLKNGDFLQCFLSNLFKLMSSEIFQNIEGKTKPLTDCFLKNPIDSTCYNKFCDSETIDQMVCYLYKTSLVQLPALVRQWWTDLDMKASHVVDRITTLYVSPHLCLEELNDVMNYQNVFKNMKVKVMLSIREILAVYTVDETQMELTITLPVNYPLGSPTVQCNKQISGANQKQWLLQFKKCVLHQNGRILDGLALWNNNLDRKFDGVEECFICYAVLHFGTCQLPRLSCQTCKKKFHSACLYKWFSTSNKSSCPICRNLF